MASDDIKQDDNAYNTFASVEKLPPDVIFFTKSRYLADTDKNKINLGIGAYRDDNGKPMVLPVVRQMEEDLANKIKDDKEYLAIGGDKEFILASQQLILGKNSQRLKNGFVAGVQGISGTGSLRVLFDFVAGNFRKGTKVLISKPTWGNHQQILNKSKLKFEYYQYWDVKNRCLFLKQMLQDLNDKSAEGDVVLFHGCAHNPTGVDPTKEQWNEILKCVQKNKLVPFFDCAYQGFATGSLENDAYAIRLFDESGVDMLIAQSYSKNLGLYCERVGCATVVCQNKEQANAVNTQLCSIVRPMYSNPPAHGARIVKGILNNDEYYKLWNKQMSEMSQRIIKMRKLLRAKLEELKTPGTWNHITDQIGMFTFSGLTPEQCDIMESKFHIYMLRNGRISMAGVASSNYEYLAKAIDYVVRNITSNDTKEDDIDDIHIPTVLKFKNPFEQELIKTANLIATKGKGILAADESTGTIGKRFANINVINTEPNRRRYRQLLFTTPGLNKYISGVIMYEETLKQIADNGTSFVNVLKNAGIVPGIKNDLGTRALPYKPNEFYTQGLTDLDVRNKEYYKLGARFCKWRAVLKIQNNKISETAIKENAWTLARYAAISQMCGLAPIVEPEILIDGPHSIKTCQYWTEKVITACYKALNDQEVILEGSMLKPNMVIAGNLYKGNIKPSFELNAKCTLQALKRSVPTAVPSINFLSGGQSEEQATRNLNEINKLGPLPWQCSFSFGRALQQSCLKAWKGDNKNIKAAQDAFLIRAKANYEAVLGKYKGDAATDEAKKSLHVQGYTY